MGTQYHWGRGILHMILEGENFLATCVATWLGNLGWESDGKQSFPELK